MHPDDERSEFVDRISGLSLGKSGLILRRRGMEALRVRNYGITKTGLITSKT
jgi:hypothetical protein